MLINTIKDCIKYENWMDPDMAKIMNLLAQKNKTEDKKKKKKKTMQGRFLEKSTMVQ